VQERIEGAERHERGRELIAPGAARHARVDSEARDKCRDKKKKKKKKSATT